MRWKRALALVALLALSSAGQAQAAPMPLDRAAGLEMDMRLADPFGEPVLTIDLRWSGLQADRRREQLTLSTEVTADQRARRYTGFFLGGGRSATWTRLPDEESALRERLVVQDPGLISAGIIRFSVEHPESLLQLMLPPGLTPVGGSHRAQGTWLAQPLIARLTLTLESLGTLEPEPFERLHALGRGSVRRTWATRGADLRFESHLTLPSGRWSAEEVDAFQGAWLKQISAVNPEAFELALLHPGAADLKADRPAEGLAAIQAWMAQPGAHQQHARAALVMALNELGLGYASRRLAQAHVDQWPDEALHHYMLGIALSHNVVGSRRGPERTWAEAMAAWTALGHLRPGADWVASRIAQAAGRDGTGRARLDQEGLTEAIRALGAALARDPEAGWAGTAQMMALFQARRLDEARIRIERLPEDQRAAYTQALELLKHPPERVEITWAEGITPEALTQAIDQWAQVADLLAHARAYGTARQITTQVKAIAPDHEDLPEWVLEPDLVTVDELETTGPLGRTRQIVFQVVKAPLDLEGLANLSAPGVDAEILRGESPVAGSLLKAGRMAWLPTADLINAELVVARSELTEVFSTDTDALVKARIHLPYSDKFRAVHLALFKVQDEWWLAGSDVDSGQMGHWMRRLIEAGRLDDAHAVFKAARQGISRHKYSGFKTFGDALKPEKLESLKARGLPRPDPEQVLWMQSAFLLALGRPEERALAREVLETLPAGVDLAHPEQALPGWMRARRDLIEGLSRLPDPDGVQAVRAFALRHPHHAWHVELMQEALRHAGQPEAAFMWGNRNGELSWRVKRSENQAMRGRLSGAAAMEAGHPGRALWAYTASGDQTDLNQLASGDFIRVALALADPPPMPEALLDPEARAPDRLTWLEMAAAAALAGHLPMALKRLKRAREGIPVPMATLSVERFERFVHARVLEALGLKALAQESYTALAALPDSPRPVLTPIYPAALQAPALARTRLAGGLKAEAVALDLPDLKTMCLVHDNPLACLWAFHHPPVDWFGFQQRPRYEARWLKAACDRGDIGACMHGAGAKLSNPRLSLKGRAMARAACDAGAPRGCTLLGDFLSQGQEGPEDPEDALALYAQSCEAGQTRGCRAWVHQRIQTAQEAAQEPDAPVLALARLTCANAGHATCRHLGHLLIHQGGSDRLKQADALLDHACKAGDLPACEAGGRLHLERRLGAQSDYTLGRDRSLKACEGDQLAACQGLLKAWKAGVAQPAFQEEALVLERTCALGVTRACEARARLTPPAIQDAVPESP